MAFVAQESPVDEEVQESPSGFTAPEAPAEAPEKPFFDLSDTLSGIWDAVKGLRYTAPAAYYQAIEGLARPDKYSMKAQAAMERGENYAREMQEKTERNRLAGESSSVGETFREVGPSLGFSLGALGSAWPMMKAGARLGALVPVAGETGLSEAVGAGIGGLAGAGVGAYRMAGAQFMNDAFQQLNAASMEKSGREMNEDEMERAYQALLPVAQNYALWEAGPEAVGNVAMLGLGKIALGIGKPLTQGAMKGLAESSMAKVLAKIGAGAAATGTEVGTETLTQVKQGLAQAQAEAIARGEDPSKVADPYAGEGGISRAFREVAPVTIAQTLLMGGAAKAADLAIKKMAPKEEAVAASQQGGFVAPEEPVEEAPAVDVESEVIPPATPPPPPAPIVAEAAPSAAAVPPSVELKETTAAGEAIPPPASPTDQLLDEEVAHQSETASVTDNAGLVDRVATRKKHEERGAKEGMTREQILERDAQQMGERADKVSESLNDGDVLEWEAEDARGKKKVRYRVETDPVSGKKVLRNITEGSPGEGHARGVNANAVSEMAVAKKNGSLKITRNERVGNPSTKSAFQPAPEGTPTSTQVATNTVVAPSVEAATEEVVQAQQNLDAAIGMGAPETILGPLRSKLEAAQKAVVPVPVIGTDKVENVPALIPNAEGQLEPNEIPQYTAAAKALQSTESTLKSVSPNAGAVVAKSATDKAQGEAPAVPAGASPASVTPLLVGADPAKLRELGKASGFSGIEGDLSNAARLIEQGNLSGARIILERHINRVGIPAITDYLKSIITDGPFSKRVTPQTERSAKPDDTEHDIWAGVRQIEDSDALELLADRLDSKLQKSGAVSWGDFPVELQNQIPTSSVATIKAALNQDPSGAIQRIRDMVGKRRGQPNGSSPKSPVTPQSQTNAPQATEEAPANVGAQKAVEAEAVADTGVAEPALQKSPQAPVEPGLQQTPSSQPASAVPASVIPKQIILAASGETTTPQNLVLELRLHSNDERSAMASELGIADISPRAIADAVIAKYRPQSGGTASIGRLEAWSKAKVQEGRSRLASGMDPELLAAHAIRTAVWIQRNGVNVTKWAKEMITEFGDSIRRHLSRIWTAAKKALDMGVDSYAKENRVEVEAEDTGYTEEQANAFAGLVSDSIDRQVEQNKKPKKIESISEAEKKGEEAERFGGESKETLLRYLEAAIEDTMLGPETTTEKAGEANRAATVGLSPEDLEAGLRAPLRESVKRGKGRGLANMVEELLFEGQNPETSPVLRKAIRQLLGIRMVPMEAVDYLLTRGRPVMEFLGNPLPRKTRRRAVDPNAKHQFFVAPDSRFKTKLQEVVGFFLPRGNPRQARALDLQSSERDAGLKGKIEDVADDVRIVTEKQLLNVDGEIAEHEVWTEDTKERVAAKLDELYPNGWVMKSSDGFGGNEIYARGPQVDQQQQGGVINTFEKNVIRRQPFVVEAFDPGIAKPMAELRMHLIVENGKAKAIPYAIGGRYNYGPFLIDTPMTQAVERVVEDMFNENVKGMKEGEIFGPDVLIRPDGSIAVVEINPVNRGTADRTEAPGYSGYMARPLWAASIVSYLRGETPATVLYARAAMRASKRRIAEIKNSDMDRHMGWLERTYRNTKDKAAFHAATIRYFGQWIEDFVDEIYAALQRTAGKVTQAMKDWMKGMMETEGGRPNESVRPPKRIMEDEYNEASSVKVRNLVRTNQATASEVLELISQTNDGFLGELAGHLANVGVGQGMNARIRVSSRSTGSPYYDPNQNLIQVRKGDEANATVLVHEIVHALTNQKIPTVLETGIIDNGHDYLAALDRNLRSASTSEPIKGIIRSYLDALDQLGLRDRLFDKEHGAFKKEPLKVDDPDIPYGLRNIDEFITGALTDENLRNTLKSLRSSYQPELSLWDQIKAFIRHLLRIPAKLNSVFDDVLEHSMNLAASEERYAPSGRLKRTDQLTEQDRIYLDAVARGDMETAQRMVDEAAKMAGYDVGPVWHHGSFDVNDNPVLEINGQGMHFGTEDAARQRAHGKQVDDFIKDGKVYYDEKSGSWFWESQGIESYDTIDERGFPSEEAAQKSLEETASEFAENDPSDATELGNFTKAFLRGRFMRDGDRIDDWRESIKKAKRLGFDGIIYKNQFEDKGSTSFIIFKPTQAKSADPITRDDQGNVIPLSQRFQTESRDIRYARPRPLRPTAQANPLAPAPNPRATGFFQSIARLLARKGPQTPSGLFKGRSTMNAAQKIWHNIISNPVDEARRIHPLMGAAMEHVDYRQAQLAKGFEERQNEAWEKVFRKLTDQQDKELRLAYLRGDIPAQHAIVSAVNPGHGVRLYEDAIRGFREDYRNAKKAGIKLNQIGRYLPTMLKPGSYPKLQEILERYGIFSNVLSILNKSASDLATMDEFTLGEEIQGALRSNMKMAGAKHAKSRTGIALDPRVMAEIAELYDRFDEVIPNYGRQMADAIVRTEVLGPDSIDSYEKFMSGNRQAASSVESGPLGVLVARLAKAGELGRDDLLRLKEVFNARLGYQPDKKIAQWLKSGNMALALGNPFSAIKQPGVELVKSLWHNGLLPTMLGIKRALTGTGLDVHKELNLSPDYEIAQGKDPIRQYNNAISRLSGFRKADLFPAKVIGNAYLDKVRRMSPQKQAKELENVKEFFAGADKDAAARDVITKINQGQYTDPDVLRLAWHGITKLRPTGLGTSPMGLVMSNNDLNRIAYNLKGWGMRNMNALKEGVYDNLRSGDADRVKEGLGQLSILAVGMVMAGAAGDALVEWLLGKDVKFSNNVEDNLLKLALGSRYQMSKAFGTKPSAKDAILNYMSTPTLSFFDAAFADIVKSARDDEKGFIDYAMKDKQLVRAIPLGLGTLTQARLGGSREDASKNIDRRSEDSFSQLNKEASRYRDMGEDKRNKDRVKRERWNQLTAWGKLKSYHVKQAKEAASRGDYDASDRIMTELEAMAKRPWSWASAARGIPRES